MIQVTGMQNPSNLLVLVLAGGAGRRIGGGKAERLLGGERLLDHAIHQALQCGGAASPAIPSSTSTIPPILPGRRRFSEVDDLERVAGPRFRGSRPAADQELSFGERSLGA